MPHPQSRPGKELEEKIGELAEEVEDRAEQSISHRENSNGFLTAEGRFLDRAEWHATAIGVSMIGMGYLFPSPIGEFFVIMLLVMLRTGLKTCTGERHLKGHLGDVIHEWAYTASFAFITALYFEFLTGFILSEIDFSRIVLAMLGGL